MPAPPFRVQVMSYSGYKGEEYPRAFSFGDVTHLVMEIVDRWYEPDAVFFKVACEDSNHYILRHGEDGNWTLVAFHSTRRR